VVQARPIRRSADNEDADVAAESWTIMRNIWRMLCHAQLSEWHYQLSNCHRHALAAATGTRLNRLHATRKLKGYKGDSSSPFSPLSFVECFNQRHGNMRAVPSFADSRTNSIHVTDIKVQ
jgi:hypothetical protein